MNDLLFLNMIERARKETERKISRSSLYSIENVLKDELEKEYRISNFDSSQILKIDDIKINKIINKEEKIPKSSIVGASMVFLGQPILRKRFVMAGSSSGTSIASKFLSSVFPQKMPIRILGTKVFGRAIGRLVPYVGWGLLIIDSIELIVTEIDDDDKNKDPFSFNGFGGGKGGGGGASWKW